MKTVLRYVLPTAVTIGLTGCWLASSPPAVAPRLAERLATELGAASADEILVHRGVSPLLPGTIIYQGTRWTSSHAPPLRASLLVGQGDTLLVEAPRDLGQILTLLRPRCPDAPDASGEFWTSVLSETGLLRAGRLIRHASELTEADRVFLRPAENLAQVRPPLRSGTSPSVLRFFVEGADGIHYVEVAEGSECKGEVAVKEVARRR